MAQKDARSVTVGSELSNNTPAKVDILSNKAEYINRLDLLKEIQQTRVKRAGVRPLADKLLLRVTMDELIERFSQLIEAIKSQSQITLDFTSIGSLEISGSSSDIAKQWVSALLERPSPKVGRPEGEDQPSEDKHLPKALPRREDIADKERYDEWSKSNGRGIIRFLENGWPAPYVKARILDRPSFRKLDESGDKALENWLGNPKHALPEHLYILSKSDLVDIELSHVDREKLRSAERLGSTLRKRQGKQQG